ncbi:MAG TPA: glutamate-1-semialdehyde 2,1-aminomutase [Candidatus Limnocylindrales bacterium]|nr:glutamate-1-semialdehyde 2,1-aminomutase [Candidatus Limnocylindrales bacterium]
MTGRLHPAPSPTESRHPDTDDLRARAASLFPGGVNSPVRAFRAVGRPPILLEAGEGPRVRDSDGRWYLDFVGSWGPAILGHRHPAVIGAIRDALDDGLALGATSPREIELGELIRDRMPSMERLRFTSSGTEAAMSAIRVARGFTRRDLVIKLAGGYHGHADPLLVDAGSGVATFGIPGSAGVPAATASTTIVAPINDLEAMRSIFDAHGSQIAAVILEPVAANVGVIPPLPGYLDGVRRLADGAGGLLIFDEVITGFRVDRGGAQARFGIRPDLTVLGKIIGGGLPVGAYGGRADVMAVVAPDGPVYQAGTLSGHPLTMAAGAATLRALDAGVYERLERAGARLEAGLGNAAARSGASVAITRVGSLLTVFFRGTAPTSMAEAMTVDRDAYARFFGAMLDRNILLPPSQFEAWFLSAAHDDTVIDEAIDAAAAAFEAALARAVPT